MEEQGFYCHAVSGLKFPCGSNTVESPAGSHRAQKSHILLPLALPQASPPRSKGGPTSKQTVTLKGASQAAEGP